VKSGGSKTGIRSEQSTRLALALLLYLGVRRGDAVRIGRQHVKDGWLRFVPRKTRYRRERMSEKPILPVLADIIARSPTGDLTFLVTSFGKPFTAAGFGNWFRELCDEAGCPDISAHGGRKATARRLAGELSTIRRGRVDVRLCRCLSIVERH